VRHLQETDPGRIWRVSAGHVVHPSRMHRERDDTERSAPAALSSYCDARRLTPALFQAVTQDAAAKFSRRLEGRVAPREPQDNQPDEIVYALASGLRMAKSLPLRLSDSQVPWADWLQSMGKLERAEVVLHELRRVEVGEGARSSRRCSYIAHHVE
jgi:hypothetical protein